MSTSAAQPLPNESAQPAIARVLRHILDDLEASVPATRKGRDPEALHAFRVAVRQTRAIASSFRSYFDPAQIDAFLNGFDWLGSVTGPARDLDIYLLSMDSFERSLPTVEPASWQPLRDVLAGERRLAHRALLNHLQNSRYEQLIASGRSFLATTPAADPDALLGPVVSDRLWRLYRRLVKAGREALTSTDNQKRHEVRITAKKLRYVLEAFSECLDAELVEKLVYRLKDLQTVLGDHHDLTVLRDRLPGFGELVLRQYGDAVPTLLALGRLDGLLEKRQKRANEAFAARFSRLDQAAFRKRLKQA